MIGALASPSTLSAADPQADARSMVTAMADAVMDTLRAGPDKAAREARFRDMYRRYFDNAAIAAFVAGRVFAIAAPAERQAFLETFEEYVVKAYSAQLANYSGERLRVDRVEPEGDQIGVISHLVPPDPTAPAEIEVRWRLHQAGGQLRVVDVVVDKISMSLTERTAFAEWMREGGGSLAALTAKLKERIALIDRTL